LHQKGECQHHNKIFVLFLLENDFTWYIQVTPIEYGLRHISSNIRFCSYIQKSFETTFRLMNDLQQFVSKINDGLLLPGKICHVFISCSYDSAFCPFL